MASGSFAVASSNKYVSCTCWWSSSTNTNGNYSTVNFELRASRTNSGYTTYGTGSGNVTINGTTVSFSITSSQKITQNSNTLLGSGSVVVYHNDDGSKSVTISAYASIPGASLTLGTTSATVALDTIARASVPTLNASTFTITMKNENYMRIYTNRKSSSFTHHVYYSFNGSSEVCLGTGVTEYHDWYFPNTLANNIPNASSGTGYIRLYTFNGSTNIGSKTVSFTMQIDDEFVPSVTLEIKDAEGYFEQYGRYIQGNSKITGVITAEGSYGSTIKSYKTTFDGKTYSDSEFTSDAIVSGETQKITVTVTDSRGRIAIAEEDVPIYEYKTPKIISARAKRCTEDGTSGLQGNYLNFTFDSEVTSLDGQNPITYSLEYRNISESSYDTVILDEFANESVVENGSYIFAVDKDAYSIILTVTDGFGYVQKKAVGPSISVLLSKLRKGLGYAIGKFAELEGVFDVGFATRFSGGILHLVLEEGTNLDEVLTPNIYAGRDVAMAGYSRIPTDYTEGKFTLDVVSCGDNGELKQTFSTCNKEDSQVYVRFYYEGEWGEWMNQFAELNSKLCDTIYPVGSIYMSVINVSPEAMFGGVWERLKDRFLLGSGNSYSNGGTGGSATVTLTVGQMPSHSHVLHYNFIAGMGANYGTKIGSSTHSGLDWLGSPGTSSSGNNEAHNNMPPYLVVNMWKRIA